MGKVNKIRTFFQKNKIYYHPVYWFYQIKNFFTVHKFGTDILVYSRGNIFALKECSRADTACLKNLKKKTVGDEYDISLLSVEIKYSKLLKNSFLVFIDRNNQINCVCFHFKNGYEKITDYDFRIHVQEKIRYGLQNKFYYLKKL